MYPRLVLFAEELHVTSAHARSAGRPRDRERGCAMGRWWGGKWQGREVNKASTSRLLRRDEMR